jgi:hypothetical protein
VEETVPHRTGSFDGDRNDLLARFADRRKHDRPRAELLEKAQREAIRSDGCPMFRLNQALFERSELN